MGSLLFLSGLMAGVTTSFIQQKGCFLVISFALALLILHRENWIRPSLIVCSGYFSVLLIELSSYAAAKAIPDLIYANFIWPLKNYNSLNSSPYGFAFFQHMWPQWFAALRLQCPLPIAYAGSFVLSVPYLLVLAVPLLLPVMAWCWHRDAFSRELLPYWLTGYALWLSELQRLDIGHLRNGSIILVLLFFALCERHRRAYPKHVAFGIIACLLLNGMVNVAAAAMARVPIHSRKGTLYSYKKTPLWSFCFATPSVERTFSCTHTGPSTISWLTSGIRLASAICNTISTVMRSSWKRFVIWKERTYGTLFGTQFSRARI